MGKKIKPKLYRIVEISDDDAYRYHKELIGRVGAIDNCIVGDNGWVGGKFTLRRVISLDYGYLGAGKIKCRDLVFAYVKLEEVKSGKL